MKFIPLLYLSLGMATKLLLEREYPLRELDTALKEATAGEGRVALVSGEAGIGKTSLVEQFARERRDAACGRSLIYDTTGRSR